jgi:hypothetical protein
MDIQAVRDGLAANAREIDGLTALGYAPDDGETPLFYVGDVDIESIGFGRAGGRERLSILCRVLVSRADDKTGQELLAAYLKGSGATSLIAAIEADKTLGGACENLQVVRRSGFRKYPLGSNEYFGAEIAVEVIGLGD